MRHAVPALAVFPLLLLASSGCAQSWPLLARNAFASTYWCPVNQIEVRPEPGSEGTYRVAGCGQEVKYVCSGAGDSRACQARQRIEYEATDGTAHGAWLEEETSSNHAMAREAAVASAAHDLPCAPASLQVVGGDPNGFANVIEGCGQRVTYQVMDVDEPPTTSNSAPVTKHKYVVLSRSPLVAPGPPVTPPSASTPPAPAPTPAPSAPPPAPPPAASASPLSTPR